MPETNCKVITVVSFGYKHLTDPAVAEQVLGADILHSVRFLKNPYHVNELRHLDGRHQSVSDFVRSQSGFAQYFQATWQQIQSALDCYLEAAGDNYQEVRIAFGCAGGRQRSVVFAELTRVLIENYLQERNWHHSPEQVTTQSPTTTRPAVRTQHLTLDLDSRSESRSA